MSERRLAPAFDSTLSGVALLAMAGLGYLLYGSRPAPPSYAEARAVVERHCLPCHSEHPTTRAFPIAPAGLLLDTPEQMRTHAERSRVRVAVERTMPLLNKTGITDEERSILAHWVEAGARIP